MILSLMINRSLIFQGKRFFQILTKEKIEIIDIEKKLMEFHHFLIKVDHSNDQEDLFQRRKETA